MGDHLPQVERVLRVVRRRWRWLVTLRSAAVAGLGAAAVLLLAFLPFRAGLAPSRLLPAVAALAACVAAILLGWAMRRVARRPTDRQVARFIEERWPQLEDRLATAVDLAERERSPQPGAMADLLGRDTIGRLESFDVGDTVPRRSLRRAAAGGLAALAAAGIAAVVVRAPVAEAATLVLDRLVPSRSALDVQPGDVTIKSGEPLRIVVRPGVARQPGDVRLVIDEAGREQVRQSSWTEVPLVFAFDRIAQSFTYRVESGAFASRRYRVTVLAPPRVARIDLRYLYPPGLGLAPRTERDGGDIYAPAGTRVQLRVETDRPVKSGSLQLSAAAGEGPDAGHESSRAGASPAAVPGPSPTRALPLHPAAGNGNVLEAELTVIQDGSYRLGLLGADGVAGETDAEYYVRLLDDRPPVVRIVRPAGDRRVTPVEEVVVEVDADDDFGVEALELVYSVKGGQEQTLPIASPGGRQAVKGRRLLYLEDLQVEPGDFISYYARARDAARTRRRGPSRSDLFFLEVRPFEEAFSPAESDAPSGDGSQRSLDDLASAQKEIIVATWKQDRRSASAGAAPAQEDIRAIARAQADLAARAAAARGTGGNSGGPLASAVEAMERARRALEAMNTGAALPPETEAYRALLLARAESQRTQLARSQGASGGGGGGRSDDLSALFDHELRREQQTAYETPRRPGTPLDAEREQALQRVRELARRQGDLSQQQRDLAGQQRQLDAEEFKRRLERLSREQSEIRRQAEDLAREMSSGDPKAAGGRNSRAARRLQEATDDMRGAANDLRRGDPGTAGERGGRAAGKLHDAERQAEGTAGERRASAQPRTAGDHLGAQLDEVRAARERLRAGEQRIRELEARQASEAGRGRSGAGEAGQGGQRPRTGRDARGGESGADPAGTAGRHGPRSDAVNDALARARADHQRQLEEAAELASRLQRDHAGVGYTPEGQQMVLSAPGFHQDYSSWAELAHDVGLTLEQAAAALESAMGQRTGRALPGAGGADAIPTPYRSLVEKYYRELAKKR